MLICFHSSAYVAQEKYAPTPFAVVRSGPAAALHSLPVELFRMIFDLLPRSSQIDLGLVCMRLLELSSAVLCNCVGIMQSGDALDFVTYRVSSDRLRLCVVSFACQTSRLS